MEATDDTTLDVVYETRRANLRSYAAMPECGSQAALADKLGVHAVYVSQLIGENPMRTISEKAARKFESRLGLQAGWLDMVRGS